MRKEHKYKGIIMENEEQIKFAEFLTSIGKKWSYRPKEFKITKKKSYIPDFKTTNNKTIYWRVRKFNQAGYKIVSEAATKYPDLDFFIAYFHCGEWINKKANVDGSWGQ